MSAVRPIFDSLNQRTVIVGNSGAGKSALAKSLAALIHVPVIDLDLLNWEGDGYGRKRDEDAARRMTSKFPHSRSGLLKAYMAGLPRSLFPGQRHSFGWMFHGAFAVRDCSRAVHAEEQRIRTPRSF
jgi:ABC-type antimicrobial peptide transport system ATPase subunit